MYRYCRLTTPAAVCGTQLRSLAWRVELGAKTRRGVGRTKAQLMVGQENMPSSGGGSRSSDEQTSRLDSPSSSLLVIFSLRRQRLFRGRRLHSVASSWCMVDPPYMSATLNMLAWVPCHILHYVHTPDWNGRSENIKQQTFLYLYLSRTRQRAGRMEGIYISIQPPATRVITHYKSRTAIKARTHPR